MNDKIESIFKVAYLPKISTSLYSFIRINVTSELGNIDTDTQQYYIDAIIKKAKKYDYKILQEDQKILDYLKEQEVEYIEI